MNETRRDDIYQFDDAEIAEHPIVQRMVRDAVAARDAEIREALKSDAVLGMCGRMGQGITSTEWNNIPAEQRARIREMASWYIGPLFKVLGLAEEGAER